MSSGDDNTRDEHLAVTVYGGDLDGESPSGSMSGGDASLIGTRLQTVQVGRFLMLERLGVGGMGAVYAAYDPDLDRRVAIKVLRHEGGNRGATRQARLVREAQAMARVTHPNVITVHEVGMHEGRVFIAMEYVDGRTLSGWLRGDDRSWREILDMFVAAGRGLAAAHEAELVHRDFKPENVMVGSDGRPRVMDFGLVLPLSGATSDSASLEPHAPEDVPANISLTRTGAVLGTPHYMAPEQFSGTNAGPRTDQFSFCVALFEALYGARPFVGDTFAELALTVTSGEIRDVPHRGVPTWIRKALVRGLSVAPAERWPSMDALLRHLSTDPSADRKRWLTVAGSLALVGVAAGSLTLMGEEAAEPCAGGDARIQGVWNDARRGDVESAFRGSASPLTESALARVQGLLDARASQWVAGYREACMAGTVRKEQSGDLMDRRMSCLDRDLQRMDVAIKALSSEVTPGVVEKAVDLVASLPPVARCSDAGSLLAAVAPPDASVADTVASARGDLGGIEARLELDLRDGLTDELDGLLTRAQGTGYGPLVAEVQMARGQLSTASGEHEPAREHMERAYLAALAAGDDELAATIAAKLAFVVGVRLGDLDAGRAWLGHAEALETRLDGPPLLRATRLATLGVMQYREGKPGPARDALVAALELRREHLGEKHPETFALVNNLGAILAMSGKEAEANERFEQAAGLASEAYGDEHPITTAARLNLGNIALRKADYEEARRIFTEVVEVRERVLGPDHPDLAQALNNLGIVLGEMGRHEEALAIYERSLRGRRKALGEDHVDMAPALNNMASTLVRLRRFEEALDQAREAANLWTTHLGPQSPSLAQALDIEGLALLGLGRVEEAVQTLDRARSLVPEDGDPLLRASVELSQVRAWWEAGRHEEATALARDVARALKDRPDHATAREAAAWLAEHAPTAE